MERDLDEILAEEESTPVITKKPLSVEGEGRDLSYLFEEEPETEVGGVEEGRDLSYLFEEEEPSATLKVAKNIAASAVSLVGENLGVGVGLLEKLYAPYTALVGIPATAGRQIIETTGKVREAIIGDPEKYAERQIVQKTAASEIMRAFKENDYPDWDLILNPKASPSDIFSFIGSQSIQMIPGIVAALKTKGLSLIDTALIQGSLGAVQTGAMDAADNYLRVLDMPQEIWDKDSDYQELVKTGVNPEEAKRNIAESKATMVGFLTAPAGAIGQAVSFALPKALKGTLAGRFLKTLLMTATTEPPTESFETYIDNVFAKQVDPSVDVQEGVLDTAFKTLIFSGGQGAVVTALNTPQKKYGGLTTHDAKLAVDKEIREKTMIALDTFKPDSSADQIRLGDAKKLVNEGRLQEAMFYINDLLENAPQEDVTKAVETAVSKVDGKAYALYLSQLEAETEEMLEDRKKEEEKVKYKTKVMEEVTQEIEAEKEEKRKGMKELYEEEALREEEIETAKKTKLMEEEMKIKAERFPEWRKGEQGKLITEELEEMVVKKPEEVVEEEVTPPTREKQLEMLTEKTGKVLAAVAKKTTKVAPKELLKGEIAITKEELEKHPTLAKYVEIRPEIHDVETVKLAKEMTVHPVSGQPKEVEIAKPIKLISLPEGKAPKYTQEQIDKVTREAQSLGISRKGKTIDVIQKEIEAVKATIPEEKIELPSPTKISDKKTLLPKLRKIIDRIYTEDKGYNEEDREKVYVRLSKNNAETLHTTITNMIKHHLPEVREVKMEEKIALREEVEERKKEVIIEEEEIEEEERFQAPDRQDLSNTTGNKLIDALTKSALNQIKANPITFEEWSNHILSTFTVTKKQAADIWAKAIEQFNREIGLEERQSLEDFMQNSFNLVETGIRETFGAEIAEIQPHEVNVDEMNAMESFEEWEKGQKLKRKVPRGIGVSNGVITAYTIANEVKTGTQLVGWFERSSNRLLKVLGEAILMSPEIMAQLEATEVVFNPNTKKRSEAATWIEKNTKTGEMVVKRVIYLNSNQFSTKNDVEMDIAHEIGHILTMTKMKASPQMKVAISKLVDICKTSLTPEQKARLKWTIENNGKQHKDSNEVEFTILYGLQNEDEFVATMLSDVRFQEWASKIKYEDTTKKQGFLSSIWNKFVSLVQTFVYEGRIEHNVLDAALREIGRIVSAPSPKVTERVTMRKEEAKAPQRTEDLLDGLSSLTGDVSLKWSNFKKLIRTPVWNKTMQPVVDKLYATDRNAHEVSFRAARMIKFLKEADVDMELRKSIVNSDAAGTRVGYDELSPTNKVKFNAIRSALDYVYRDRMKEFYVKDKVYRAERKLKRKLTGEETTEIKREAASFIRKHYAATIYDETKKLSKEEVIQKCKKEGVELTGKETKEELLDKFGEKVDVESLYFPRFRFGNQALVVKTREKKTIYFGTFDSARERNRVLENFLESGDLIYEAFDMRERFTDLSGVMFAIQNTRVLENMLKANDVTAQELKSLLNTVGEEFLKNWAGGRFAHRNEAVLAGYNTNITKALHRYIETFPRAMVRKFSMAEIEDAVDALPESEKQYGRNLVDYFLGKIHREGKVNQAIRTALFNAYLMFKPAFAVVNLTQRLITTVPKAFAEMGGDGLKAAFNGQSKELAFYQHQLQTMQHTYDALDSFKPLERGDKMILKNLIAEGVIAPLRTHEIVEKSRLGRSLAFFGNVSEKSNRLMTALTALEIGHMKGLEGSELQKYVMEFVNGTQWLYNKANRPAIARGILAPVMMFKSFVLNDLNFLKTLYPNKQAFGMAMAGRLSLGGVGGIYGAGAFMSVVNLVMSTLVGDDDWALDKKEFVNKFPRWFIDGLPAFVGVSGSSMFGSSELFGTAVAPYVKSIYGVGAEYATLGKVRPETWRRVLPSQAKHLWRVNLKEKFQDEDIKQLPKEVRQRVMFLWKNTPREQQTLEKLLDILGFATETPQQFYESVNAIKTTGRLMGARKTQMSRDLAEALFEKDEKRAEEIRETAKKKGYHLSSTSVKRFMRRKRYAESEEE